MLLTRRDPSAPDVTRLRARPAVDSYGDPVESWGDPLRDLLPGAQLQNAGSVEADAALKRVLVNDRRLFIPYAADLTSEDRVEVLGEVWRVDGDPIVRRGLASSVYTTATLKRVTTGVAHGE